MTHKVGVILSFLVTSHSNYIKCKPFTAIFRPNRSLKHNSPIDNTATKQPHQHNSRDQTAKMIADYFFLSFFDLTVSSFLSMLVPCMTCAFADHIFYIYLFIKFRVFLASSTRNHVNC